MTDPKSCPFCGAEAYACESRDGHAECHNEECGICMICITLAAWNRRSNTYELGAAIERLRALNAAVDAAERSHDR